MLQYSQGSLHVGGLRMLYGSNEVCFTDLLITAKSEMS